MGTPDALFESLYNDVKIMGLSPKHTADEAEIQFWRRTYIRNLFAFFEGIVWLHKQYALRLYERSRVKLTVGEVALLREVQFDFQNGKVREQTKFLNFAENFRFAFYILAKIVETDYALDVPAAVWQDFKKTIDIRNRITHPKGSFDIVISAEESILIHDAAIFVIGHLLVLNVKLHEWMEARNMPLTELEPIDPEAGSGLGY